jgi:hypothetical protein
LRFDNIIKILIFLLNLIMSSEDEEEITRPLINLNYNSNELPINTFDNEPNRRSRT